MSLLNAWVRPYDAMVGVDTDGVAQDGSRIVTSKLLPIPHLSAVIAIRGQAALLAGLFVRTLSFESFDDLVDAMPALIAEVNGALPAELIVAHGVPGTGHELLAVGYSPRRERMVGRMFIARADIETQRDIADSYISPWRQSMGTATRAQDVERLARAQVRWMRSTFPNAACGGSLILCRLTRGGFALSHTMRFDEEAAAA